MKAAIYGGSFDPPHLGHIAVIEAALATLDIDTLFLVPAFLNPFKTTVFAPAHLRLKWIQTIARRYEKVTVCDFEITAQKPMPTFETVQALKLRYTFAQKPYVIIGADNLAGLSRWAHYEALLQDVTFVVAARSGYDVPSDYLRLEVNRPLSSTQLRHNLTKESLPPYLAEEIMNYYKEHHATTHQKNC